jgi:hypothetical protein
MEVIFYFETSIHIRAIRCYNAEGGSVDTENEECRPLGCDAAQLLLETKFQRNVSPPSSGEKNQS